MHLQFPVSRPLHLCFVNTFFVIVKIVFITSFLEEGLDTNYGPRVSRVSKEKERKNGSKFNTYSQAKDEGMLFSSLAHYAGLCLLIG